MTGLQINLIISASNVIELTVNDYLKNKNIKSNTNFKQDKCMDFTLIISWI